MAVAINQVGEIYQVISKYVAYGMIRPLLDDLERTQAYARNQSFKETVDRLRIEYAKTR